VAPGPFAPRAVATIVLGLLAASVAPACEATRPSGSTESRSDDPSSADQGSTSDNPASDVQVQTYRIGSRDQLVQRLGDLGWEEVIIFPNGDPKSVEIWGGDDHWHAQTHHLVTGRQIGVTQAGVGGLPPGRLVRVRGEYGIRSQGMLYWIEREFVVALSPGEEELAARLEWVPTGWAEI
jgi:hypothetical protein